jgi:hypothetical protein
MKKASLQSMLTLAMFNGALFCGAAGFALISSPPALAQMGCQLPFSPQVPDGRTADENAMRVGREAMQAFVKRADDFLQCIEQEETAAKADYEKRSVHTLEDQAVFKVKKDELERRYNAGIDAQKGAAARFNEQLRIYRARVGANPNKAG